MTTNQPLKQVFNYLTQLQKNNNREWFNRHKANYQDALTNMVLFADEVVTEMNNHDNIETKSGKQSLFRIYRDTRFSKDKTPYKTHWSGYLRRATKLLRGGYYYHLQPGGSFIAGGFFGPNPNDLKHIRSQIAQDDTELRKILNQSEVKKYFGSMEGDRVKTAPKGYKQDHPSIVLLRYKQYILRHPFTDEEVLSSNFKKTLVSGLVQLLPFFNYFSEILTTDLNGVPLYA